MSPVLDIAVQALLGAGALFVLVSALGLLRMPDLFTRMHAATKMPTLAMGLILLAAALHFTELGVSIRALLGIGFFLLTVPVSAHLLGRAAYDAGVAIWEETSVDELEAYRESRDESPGQAEDSREP